MSIENHMVIRDQDYYNEMSGISWAEQTQPCPLCQGEQWIADKCECGTMATIEEDDCALCGKPVKWHRCPLCDGKGEIPA